MICSTGASSSFKSAMHSFVGATGACTHNPPLLSLITVIRTFTETFSPNPMPCFCSKNHIFPFSISYRYVCLLNAGTKGNRGGGATRYARPLVSSLSAVPLRISVFDPFFFSLLLLLLIFKNENILFMLLLILLLLSICF